MRHKVAGRRLSRTSSHRLALRRNMVQSLIEHGEIRTTLVKAKEIRTFAEKVVNLAVKAADAAERDDKLRAVALRQQAEALLRDRAVIPAEHQEKYDALSDAKRDKVLRARSGRRYRATTTKPGVEFTAGSVLNKLFAEVGPQMLKRGATKGVRGGYTRIIPLGQRRLGDGGQLAILELVAEDDTPRKKNPATSERRRRAKVRYDVYAGKPRAPRQRRKSAAKKSEAADAT